MGDITSILDALATPDGMIASPADLVNNQFGVPLTHLSQQYLFGATGLRLGVFYSISGNPGTGKSTLVYDWIGQLVAPGEDGKGGGIGMIYDLEDKLNPTLLSSVLAGHKGSASRVKVSKKATLEQAISHLTSVLIPMLKKSKDYIPAVVDFDTIGGAATDDVSGKLSTGETVGKGLNDKPHVVKHFFENIGNLISDLPIVFFCVNQEKEKIATSAFAAKPKEMMKITGGVSQIYKDGWMGHADYNKLPNGKLIRIRTVKTSFSDDREIQVQFRWNESGDVSKATGGEDFGGAYGHCMDWPLATATLLATGPQGVVGTIRSICDVRLAKDLVTCPTLGLKDVPADVFEKELMGNQEIYGKLLTYLKIDRLRDASEYRAYLEQRQAAFGAKPADKPKRKARTEKPDATAAQP